MPLQPIIKTDDLTIKTEVLDNDYIIGVDLTEADETKATFKAKAVDVRGRDVISLDTITDMEARSGSYNGQGAQLNGFHVANDGGGGMFFWDATYIGDAINGMAVYPTGGSVGAWLRIYDSEVYPEWFGARGDGITNDTTILTFIFNNYKNVVLQKLYYLTTQGTVNDGQGSGAYAILVDSINNLKITFTEGAKLVFDRAPTEMPNLIKLKSCTNVKIINPSTEQREVALRTAKNGYQGATIYCYDCENVEIIGGLTVNNLYHVQTYLCNNITVSGGTGINDYYSDTDTADENAGSSFVLFYSTTNSIVEKTTSYGNWWDGQISIFGGCENVKVLNNKVIGIPYDQFDIPDFSTFRIQQGITLDQGPTGCDISGNTIDGFFYGIDQKADTQNNNIHDNTILRCKLSIADRKGEAIAADKSVEGKIQNNLILLSSDVLGAAQPGAQNPIRGYEQHGIASETRLSCDITNNKIMMDLNNSGSYGTYKIVGVFADFDESLGGEYRPTRVIKGNNVVFQLGQDATVRSAPVNSVAYVLEDATRLVVADNSYSLSFGVTTYAFRFISDVIGGYFSNNKGLVNQGVEFLLDATDSITDSVFASQNKPDNLDCYSFKERNYVKTFGRIPIDITNSVLTTFFEVTTSTDDDTTIKLSLISEANGGIYWEGIVHFRFNIDGSIVTSEVTVLASRNVNNLTVDSSTNFVAEIKINTVVDVPDSVFGLNANMEVINSSDNITVENV